MSAQVIQHHRHTGDAAAHVPLKLIVPVLVFLLLLRRQSSAWKGLDLLPFEQDWVHVGARLPHISVAGAGCHCSCATDKQKQLLSRVSGVVAG